MKRILPMIGLVFLGCSDAGPKTPSLDGVWRGSPADQSIRWTMNLADNDGSVNGCAEALYSPASGLGTVRYTVSGTRDASQASLNLTPVLQGFVTVTHTLSAAVRQDTMTATLAGQSVLFARRTDIQLGC